MAAIFAFRCTCCGKIHEGSPSFGFQFPDQYASLTVRQKAEMGTLTEDFCTITRDDGTDRFIRVVLEVLIHGVDQAFLWGVWVSLSEKSFNRYRETYNEPVVGDGFFGWVCNSISLYPYEQPRPGDIVVRGGNLRPRVVLHRGEPEYDQLVLDQQNGISVARAQELAELALHQA